MGNYEALQKAERERRHKVAGDKAAPVDALDWDDDLRVAIEERAALSPDALTGMEASLRFPGPETLETKRLRPRRSRVYCRV